MRRFITKLVLGIGLGLADHNSVAFLGRILPGIAALPPAGRAGMLLTAGSPGNTVIYL